MDKELIIFCDESDRRGKFFSNFYGGVLVGSSQYEQATRMLNQKKEELHFFGEVKWQKVSERYLNKYKALVTSFFDEVVSGKIKVRVMFTQNAYVPKGLLREQVEIEYFLLYYQFIKHAFGLQHNPFKGNGVRLRLYFDVFPHKREKVEQFKGFLLGLGKSDAFRIADIHLQKEDIAEVRSHEHVLLQCLDIVLGAMAFRLNEKHKGKMSGQRRRGKKTVAKEQLYRHILAQIRRIFPGFNVGVSTEMRTGFQSLWNDPYRHWRLVPRNSHYDEALTK
ncbi:MAG: DUF3800 domain-containing protein [bacterium]